MDLFVTNKNDFTHEDRYAGQDYLFPPGEKVLISEQAATHMFGFNRVDKTDTLARLGWANPRFDRMLPNGQPDTSWGAKQLAKFVFTRAQVVEVPAEPPAETPAPEAHAEEA